VTDIERAIELLRRMEQPDGHAFCGPMRAHERKFIQRVLEQARDELARQKEGR
jgi:hypothetical protein